jgi:hypothetical protein
MLRGEELGWWTGVWNDGQGEGHGHRQQCRNLRCLEPELPCTDPLVVGDGRRLPASSVRHQTPARSRINWTSDIYLKISGGQPQAEHRLGQESGISQILRAPGIYTRRRFPPWLSQHHLFFESDHIESSVTMAAPAAASGNSSNATFRVRTAASKL